MENIRDLYILGLPIDTKIGKLKFIKIKDYPTLGKYVGFLNLQKFEVIEWVKPLNNELADILKNEDFVTIIKGFEALGLYAKYKELFKFFFDEDVFDLIETDEDFEYYRDLIRKVNCIPVEKKNPNPEIDRFIKMKKYYESKKNGELTFESMISSVWVELGKSPLNLTIYQLYSLFSRISQIKSYESLTLYSTVATDIQVQPWYQHIDILENKENEKSVEEYTGKINKMMNI